MNTALDCPSCGSTFGKPTINGQPVPRGDEMPHDGEACVCITCGYLGVWHGGSFVPADADERAALLADDDVINLLTMGRERELHRANDRELALGIVSKRLPLLALMSRSQIELVVDDLLGAGFHTHRPA